jgi:Protein of unknown function (DUF3050)
LNRFLKDFEQVLISFTGIPQITEEDRNMLRIKHLTQKLSPLISEISHHPLYEQIHNIGQIRLFMEQHVFAVWDFMCLLKELHRRIVSTSAPWFPPKDSLSANLISNILVEEEGDITEDGSYDSHFGIYIRAMKEIDADTSAIEKLLTLLRGGMNINAALEQIPIHPTTKHFVQTTVSFFDQELHEIAAAFVYGREGITSAMFIPLVKKIAGEIEQRNGQQLGTLLYYCNRHIELDDEEHFPRALQMLANSIGDSETKLQQAEAAAVKALMARLNFLTAIQQSFSCR